MNLAAAFSLYGELSGVSDIQFPSVITSYIVQRLSERVKGKRGKYGQHSQYDSFPCLLRKSVQIVLQSGNYPLSCTADFSCAIRSGFIAFSFIPLSFDGLQILVLYDGEPLYRESVGIVVRPRSVQQAAGLTRLRSVTLL